MDVLRVERTLLHRGFGIFRYAEELERLGIAGPYEQIVAVGRFIETRLGRENQLPRLSDDRAVEKWMREGIAVSLHRVDRSSLRLEPLEWLAIRVVPFIAWNPYREFAELLNIQCGPDAYAKAAARLRSRSFDLGLVDLTALTEQFVLRRLIRAVRTFDPREGAGREVNWLTTVFYRFALNEMLSDRVNRRHLEALTVAVREETTPEVALEEEATQRALAALPEVLRKLPQRDRCAVELYFGLGDREHTLAEIGQTLGVSEYLARTAVIRGLAALAAALGVRGSLSKEAFTLLQLMFGEGMPMTVAARRLGMTSTSARRYADEIPCVFRRSLRSRTVTSARMPVLRTGEEPMEYASTVDRDQLISELKRLHETPRLKPSLAGEPVAQIGGCWVLVSRLREIASEPAVFDSLKESGIPLDWMAVPSTTMERADLTPEALEWENQVERIAKRSWVASEALYDVSVEEAGNARVLFGDEPREHSVERIHRAVMGVGQAVRSAIPMELRRKRVARFRIDLGGAGRAVGTWSDPAREVTFDMGSVMAELASSLGEMSATASEAVARVFVHALSAGDVELPGLRRTEESSAKTTWLEWTLSSTESELMR